MKNFFKELGKGGKIALVAAGILVITGVTVFAAGEIADNRFVIQPIGPETSREEKQPDQTFQLIGENEDGNIWLVEEDEDDPIQIKDIEEAPKTNKAAEKPQAKAEEKISLDRAIEIALKQVPGATRQNVASAHKDYDDGKLVYEIEVVYGGYEYEFEINSKGNIVEKDIEKEDYHYDHDDDDGHDDDDDDDHWD